MGDDRVEENPLSRDLVGLVASERRGSARCADAVGAPRRDAHASRGGRSVAPLDVADFAAASLIARCVCPL